eukprot:CAMPEP_0197832196 /NCGR_PEP_ID=MMETSP1437-20131217/13635_1 /TAXON_ID=49252 ORGANISM="Eucampia antarctica, Strain CCMP1452" /NCGR_SAMPLE_ID=MMETSP1437 /ASSEMBLY_ACC=CAM_ASM_001096 /LENGTH=205 /DNA_ID=CAMNT_0043435421 /DNA_START=65 /DNA_END=682 /DNA_ORIENTATION=+
MQSPPSDASSALSEFQAGVTAALRSWNALRTASDSAWGGFDSRAKAEDLRTNIFSCFDGSQSTPKIELEELEDSLHSYMEDEFSVVLDDNSERQLAELIFRMYETCSVGNFSISRQVVENARKISEAYTPSKVINPDDDEEMETVNVINAQEYASQHVFGAPVPVQDKSNEPPARQLGENSAVKPQQELDDDGFATVAPKRKGKR